MNRIISRFSRIGQGEQNRAVTPEQAAANARPGLANLVGAFAESPQTLRRARLMGLSGWAYHVSARAGALGDVRPETVAAAIGFIAPEAVTDGWEAAAKTTPPVEVATWHLHELCRWGVDELGGFPRLTRLLELSRQVVSAVDGAGLPLFAAACAPGEASGTGIARQAAKSGRPRCSCTCCTSTSSVCTWSRSGPAA